MKLIHLTFATAVAALAGGAAGAQQTEPQTAPAGTEVTGPSSATFTNMTVTNGPAPDTAENRARYGSPMSRAGKRTAPAGN